MPPHLKRQLCGVEGSEDGGPPKKSQMLGFNLEASLNATSLNSRSGSEVSDDMSGICYGETTEDILPDEIICYGAVGFSLIHSQAQHELRLIRCRSATLKP
jgi:hypothetical protein